MKSYNHNMVMKRILSFFVFFSFVAIAIAQDFPATPKRLVSDYTSTLSTAEIENLERKLVAYNDTSSTQIAVVLVNSTEGYDVADYAVRLAKKWGVGQAKYNNGVMLLAAIGDRAVTIQTGYGVEGSLPDVIAYRIIENDIKPRFRNNDYYGGLDAATNSIISYTRGEYKADPKSKSEGGGIPIIFIIIVIFVVISIISKKGGGNNGGGRMINGKGSNDLFWWMLLNGMGGGNNRGSGGGFGGDSGGGFGGFGGGGFGGGGASGRW